MGSLMGNALLQSQNLTVTPQMMESLRVLSMDMGELTSYLYEQQEKNPLLEIDEYPEMDFSYARKDCSHGDDDFDPNDRLMNIPRHPTYRDELLSELNVRNLSPGEAAAARMIIQSLDHSGFFTDELDDVAAEIGISCDEAQKGLAAVQALDPPGIGARNVQECLCLQIERQGVQDDVILKIVQFHLRDILEKHFGKVARSLGVQESVVRQCFRQIRELRPKLCLNDRDVEYIVPDLFVFCQEGKIILQYNSRCLPHLVLNDYYLNLEGQDKAYRNFISKFKGEATKVIQDTTARETTLLRTAEMIVTTQKDYFLENRPLKPLSLKDLSGRLGVNISTVSKTISRKYLHCDKGTFPLKYFLSRRLAGEEGSGSISSDELRSAILGLIRETPGLSDSRIAEELNRRGIHVARRTVAKYRSGMGISSSYLRNR